MSSKVAGLRRVVRAKATLVVPFSRVRQAVSPQHEAGIRPSKFSTAHCARFAGNSRSSSITSRWPGGVGVVSLGASYWLGPELQRIMLVNDGWRGTVMQREV